MSKNIKAERKANLLRLELLDLITYDPRFNGDTDEGKVDEAGAMQAAIDWVFRDSPEEFRADLYARLIEGAWTVARFTSVLLEVVHG